MANYSVLKAAVQAVVKTNGNQAITGANLQTVLLSIINSIGGGGYIFNGVATPSTGAGTPDQNVFYIGGAGTYANFGTSVVVPPTNIAVFKYNGTWNCEQLTVENGGVFDISAFKAGGGTLATYADLAAALGTGGANVPVDVRKGGMSIKFVQTSDNKYVQCRLMADEFTTDVTQWQGVDDVPMACSDNLVKSGGVDEAINYVQYLSFSPSQYNYLYDISQLGLITGKEYNIKVQMTENVSYLWVHLTDNSNPGSFANPNTIIWDGAVVSSDIFVKKFVYDGSQYLHYAATASPFTSKKKFDNIKITGKPYVGREEINDCKSDINLIFNRGVFDAEYNAFSNPSVNYLIGQNGLPSYNDSDNFVTSDFLKVKEGEFVYFTGEWIKQASLSLVWGYSDEDYSNPVSLYPCVPGNRYVGIKIPSGVNYVKAWGLLNNYSETYLYLGKQNPEYITPHVLKYETSDGSFLSFLQSKAVNPSPFNKYLIQLPAGVIDLTNDALGTSEGITIPSYVYLKGQGIDITTLKVDFTNEEESGAISTINLCRETGLEEMTVIGIKTRYAVHDDYAHLDKSTYSNYIYDQYFKNCKFIAEDCVHHAAFGAGVQPGARWKFDNCIFISNRTLGFLWHTNNAFQIDAVLTMNNCDFSAEAEPAGSICLRSLNSGKINTVILNGCNTKGYTFRADTTQPAANPDFVVYGCGNTKSCPISLIGDNFVNFEVDFSDVLSKSISGGYLMASQKYDNGVIKYWNGSEWVSM